MGAFGWQLGSMWVALVLLAGMGGPLAALTLAIVVVNGAVLVRPEAAGWFGGWGVAVYGLLTLVQLLGNLYFVPIRVRDVQYLAPQRTMNAYLHARFQSFWRPLSAALVAAALPLPWAAQTVAVAGFVAGTTVYWFWAWVREYVAIKRGTIVLIALELLKDMTLLVAVLVVLWLPLMAALALLACAVPVAWWVWQLYHEQAPWSARPGEYDPKPER